MPRFSYTAFSRDGAKKRGILEAASKVEALQRLRADGLKVLELSEPHRRLSGIEFSRVGSILPAKVNLERFFSDTALLMDAGLGLDRALKAIAVDQNNQANCRLAQALCEELSAGKAPSEAFQIIGSGEKEVLALIASGEQTGKLPVVFSVIARNLERKRAQRSQVLEAIAYPAFLMMMMCASLLIVTFFLVPAILPIFEGADRQAPLIITALDQSRLLLMDWGALFVLSVLLAALLALRTKRGDGPNARLSALAVSMPVIGTLVRKHGLARYLHSLALLLGNGVEMSKALAFSAAACPVKAYSTKLETVRIRVVSGSRLPQALEEASIFPPAVISLTVVGDEINSLPSVLSRSAQLLEEEALRLQRRLLAFMTPAITVFMGLLIGGLVISVMSALLSINELSVQ